MTMAIGGFGGSAPFDQQTFGAAVVSKTLDYMNSSGSGSSMAPVDKASAEASLVSKTLDYGNSGALGGGDAAMRHSYNFQNSVLGAYAKGSLVNTII